MLNGRHMLLVGTFERYRILEHLHSDRLTMPTHIGTDSHVKSASWPHAEQSVSYL